jgi:large subunit ribosomal protein L15
MAYSKIRQHRGRKNCGGHKKKRRGAGNRGGRGNAGLSKHKFTWVTKNNPKYFCKPSMKPSMNKTPTMNLTQIDNIVLKEGRKDFDFSDYKILGKGNISQAIKIKAQSFSQKALEKIQKAEGTAEALYAETTETKQETKTESEPSDKVETK